MPATAAADNAAFSGTCAAPVTLIPARQGTAPAARNVDAIKAEKFRKAFPGADEYQRKLAFEITEALAKRKAPKDALETAFGEWEKITERRGRDKQKAAWAEKMSEMKALGIEYQPSWAAKAK